MLKRPPQKKRVAKPSESQPGSSGTPSILSNPAIREQEDFSLNEEWVNFSKRIGEVSNIVKDLASGDKAKSAAATVLANKYLDGKIIKDDDVELEVKNDRTVINHKAFVEVANKEGEIDKDLWMAEMSKDAERRALDRKIRREKADTLKTMATKAFRSENYEKALSCYNRAIEQVKDNAMLYCDRALTFIKLGKYEKVIPDCDLALRIYEGSFKGRLYMTKAYKELEELEKFEENMKILSESFPQHEELIQYFLSKKLDIEKGEDEEDNENSEEDNENSEEDNDGEVNKEREEDNREDN